MVFNVIVNPDRYGKIYCKLGKVQLFWIGAMVNMGADLLQIGSYLLQIETAIMNRGNYYKLLHIK